MLKISHRKVIYMCFRRIILSVCVVCVVMSAGYAFAASKYDKIVENDALELAKLQNEMAALERKHSNEEKLSTVKQTVDNLSEKIRDKSDINPDNIKPFHPYAKCQIINWELSEDAKSGKKVVWLTILHNRKSKKITRVRVPFDSKGEDTFFRIRNLPVGLQVVMPPDDEGTWTVNVNAILGNRTVGKGGYYVARIEDPDDIPNSKLDGESNLDDYGGKTFESGEAFIILRQSGMTIRPPAY